MAQSPPSAPWSPDQQSQPFPRKHSLDPSIPSAKRQRMSPNPPNGLPSPYTPPASNGFPSSPYSSIPPSFRNFQLPQGAFNPRASTNGSTPSTPQFQTPVQNPSGIMGPPQRPIERQMSQPQIKQEEDQPQKEKYMDINDLSDLVTSSGIDLRREEELMHTSFHGRAGNTSQAQTPNVSFDLLRNSFGNIGERGALNQPPASDMTEELEKKHRATVRAYNEQHQFELNDPFLLANAIRRRMERIAAEVSIKLPMEGLFDKIGPKVEEKAGDKPRTSSGQALTNSKEGIVVAKAPSILNKGASFDNILSLLSLASNDRCRSLIEDAYSITRGRQITTDGLVPPEWAQSVQKSPDQTGDPAKASSQSITNTSWDNADSKTHSAALNGETTVNGHSSTAELKDTVTFPPQSRSVNKALGAMIRRDRGSEETRIKRRNERRSRRMQQSANGIVSESNTVTPDGSAPGTPNPGRAPEPKMTKKEAEKARKAEVLSERQQTLAANSTMQAQLGGKKYSWMKSAANKASMGAAGRPGAGLGGVASPRPGNVESRGGLPSTSRDRRYGVWREDSASGKNVQLRDWISVLEMDGKEKKALYNAMSKLGREKDDTPK